MKISFLHAILIWLLVAVDVWAHPVAQGSLDVDVRGDGVWVTARVSNEQIFVASAFGKDAGTATDLTQFWPVHRDYLIQHLRLTADGEPMTGSSVAIHPPEDKTVSGYTIYELRYDWAGTGKDPHEISVQQDLLNEIQFAPGNPWEATFVVRHRQSGKMIQEGLLLTRKGPLTFSRDASPQSGSQVWSLATSYLRHGVFHILEGWDHLLFMAALVLAAASFWDLIKVVTAFTLAHTLTLALSVFNLVRLPSQIVEPMIALSIIVVAAQNVFWPQRSRGNGRLVIAFAFGLFHGLGFAGGLLEAMQGMSGVAVVTALVGFSAGVEIGHQVVVLPLFAIMGVLRHTIQREWLSMGAMRYGSTIIGIAGVFYFASALRG